MPQYARLALMSAQDDRSMDDNSDVRNEAGLYSSRLEALFNRLLTPQQVVQLDISDKYNASFDKIKDSINDIELYGDTEHIVTENEKYLEAAGQLV